MGFMQKLAPMSGLGLAGALAKKGGVKSLISPGLSLISGDKKKPNTIPDQRARTRQLY